jgi:predicted RNA-binding Zn ribbon-like protein
MDILETTTEPGTHAGNLTLTGGALCLDFTNTMDWRLRPQPQEWLTDYADLVAWSRHVQILTDAQTSALLTRAAAQPDAACAVLDRALTLREAIYRIFVAVAHAAAPAPPDLAILNTELAGALARLRVVPAGADFAWDWDVPAGALDWMLWPVVRSTADLLVSDALSRVHECGGTDCGWLFLDTSRNGSRRWCSMDGCGNRAKARRHYARQRKT